MYLRTWYHPSIISLGRFQSNRYPIKLSYTMSTIVTRSGKPPVISVAPMVDVTDQYFRYLCRLLSVHTVLYTPMITDLSLLRDIHGTLKHLSYDKSEHKLVLQLGGNNIETMCSAARIGESYGYDEININLGCPATSATSHSYGVVLMRDPGVFKLIDAVSNSVNIPVTVKCRIGVYNTLYQCNHESHEIRYQWLYQWMVQLINHTNVRTVILHCRTAILNFRPDKNRTVPELLHSFAYQLKYDLPQLQLHINGEINSIEDIKLHIDNGMDGCMLGRAVWKNPFMLSQIDELLFNEPPFQYTRIDIIKRYLQYCQLQIDKQMYYKQTMQDWKPQLKNLLTPIGYLCNGTHNNKSFRILLTELNQQFRSYYIHNNKQHVDQPPDITHIILDGLNEIDDPALYSIDYTNIRAENQYRNPQSNKSLQRNNNQSSSNCEPSDTESINTESINESLRTVQLNP